MHCIRMENELDLKTLRGNRKISQAELAELLGVNTSTVWRWENEGIPSRGASRKALERWAIEARS